MKNGHSLRQWLETVRYWSFPMSLCPVVATVAYLYWRGETVDAVAAVAAMVAIVLFQAAGNLISDYNDFRSGVDSEKSYGVDLLVKGTFTPKEYLIEAVIILTLSLALGLMLVFRGGGLPLFLIGLAGLLLAVFYSPLKSRALGDLDIFLVYALFAITGTSYAVTGVLHPESLVLMMPIGLITVAVLHANNTRDIETDREAGIRTVAMILGYDRSIRLYVAYIFLPFLFVIAGVLAGLLPWTALLCLITAPLSYKIAKGITHVPSDDQRICDLDQRTAMLQLSFTTTLIIGICIGIWT